MTIIPFLRIVSPMQVLMGGEIALSASQQVWSTFRRCSGKSIVCIPTNDFPVERTLDTEFRH